MLPLICGYSLTHSGCKKCVDIPHGCGMMHLSSEETTAMDDFDLEVQCEEVYTEEGEWLEYLATLDEEG